MVQSWPSGFSLPRKKGVGWQHRALRVIDGWLPIPSTFSLAIVDTTAVQSLKKKSPQSRLCTYRHLKVYLNAWKGSRNVSQCVVNIGVCISCSSDPFPASLSRDCCFHMAAGHRFWGGWDAVRGLMEQITAPATAGDIHPLSWMLLSNHQHETQRATISVPDSIATFTRHASHPPHVMAHV